MFFRRSIVSSGLLLLGSLCLFGAIGFLHEFVEARGGLLEDSGCDFGPEALTDSFGIPIPRTCIDVPYHDEKSTATVKQRCYYTYVPDSCYAPDSSSPLTSNDIKKVPLVLDVHGYGVCPLFQAAFTGWKEKAEEECFVVVWPSGNNDEQFGAPCFNLEGFLRSEDYGTATGNNMTTCPCCCYKDKGAPTKEPNDPLFLKLAIESVVESFEAKTKPAPTMTDHTSTRLAIDPTRVYMAGHSNGCIASLAMAALYSDTIAAVCCHAGAVVTPFSDQDYRPVPIWLAHGKKDKVVPYEGATLFDGPPVGAIGFWSTDQTMDYLAKQNDCEEETITTLETNQTGIVGTVFRQTRCHQNANIEVVALFESGHFPYELPESFFIGLGLEETPTKIDTTSLAWDFCSKHVNPNAATPDHEPIPQWISTLNSGSIHQSIRNRA